MITLIANTKGGVGKTSLATSILAELAKEKAVIGVDLDSVNKAASEEWSKERNETDGRFYFLSGEIRSAILEAAENYDEVVIDAGGYDNTEYRQALAIADVVIIPLLVGSSSNIEGLRKVAETIELLRSDNPPKVYGIVTKAPNMAFTPEFKRALEEIENDPLVQACPVSIGDRVWYTRAFDERVGITDLKPLKRNETRYIEIAKNEFMQFFNFIYGEKND